MTKYFIVLIRWDILNKDRKICVHQKTVIMVNPFLYRYRVIDEYDIKYFKITSLKILSILKQYFLL